MAKEVFPGLSKHLRTEHFTERERRIIKTLSCSFYVTNGGESLRVGNSTYRYCFIKFPDDYKQIFRAESEMIVLFSPYENFENRTLDVLDRIIDESNSVRLDKICAFVVSADPGFSGKLMEITKANKEMWTIVPFSYEELDGGGDKAFIRLRVQTYFFSRDLFDFESPLREERYFFGRERIVHSLVEKHLLIENSGIFGLRRSGKTSILYAVKRLAEARGSIATIVDGQALNVRSWFKALFYIANRINQDHSAKIKIVDDEYTADLAADSFEMDIQKIYRKSNKKILILIDEVEHITFGVSGDRRWSEGEFYLKFWHVIRSVFNRPDNCITFLIAGTNPLCVEKPYVGKIDNPLYGQIKPEYIEPFDVDLTAQMVQALGGHMGLSFSSEICAYLTRDYGGHPFLIRQACSSIYRKLSIENDCNVIDRRLYEDCKEDFDSEKGQGYCEMIVGILAEFYEDEYEMLCMLANGEMAEFEGLAKSDFNYTKHLLGYGVIEKTISSYDFRMDVLKRYLCVKYKYRTLNLTLEERWSEISGRRNKVEQQLRELVRRQLIFLFGKEGAKQKMLSKFEGSKRRRYEGLDYDDFFNPNKCEIYFSDLTDVMRVHWEGGFRNIFDDDVEKFKSRMILLNSIGRGDAHAKEISDADFQSFRGAMAWLEEKVKSIL